MCVMCVCHVCVMCVPCMRFGSVMCVREGVCHVYLMCVLCVCHVCVYVMCGSRECDV